MIELSPEQQHEVARRGNKPVQAVDPLTRKVYYIVAGDLYQRLGGLLGDDEFDVRDTYGAQEAALAEVWDDPELDLYNDYDAHQPQ